MTDRFFLTGAFEYLEDGQWYPCQALDPLLRMRTKPVHATAKIDLKSFDEIVFDFNDDGTRYTVDLKRQSSSYFEGRVEAVRTIGDRLEQTEATIQGWIMRDGADGSIALQDGKWCGADGKQWDCRANFWIERMDRA